MAKKEQSGNMPLLPDIIERGQLDIFGPTAGVKLLDVVAGTSSMNYVEFPTGWKRVSHTSQRDALVDERGCRRATIQVVRVGGEYKCQVWPLNRFQASCKTLEERVWIGVIEDGGKLIHTTESFERWLDAENAARAWLGKNYPDWRKPGAYWD